MEPCIAGGGPSLGLGDQAGPCWGAGHVLRGVQAKPQGTGPAWSILAMDEKHSRPQELEDLTRQDG